VQANPGLALLAVATPAAGDVERHRDEVAFLDELDVPADLSDLPGDLVAERQALWSRRPAADHVLVAAADVACGYLQDYPVRGLTSHVERVDPGAFFEFETRVLGGLDLHLARALVDHSFVLWHRCSPLDPPRPFS